MGVSIVMPAGIDVPVPLLGVGGNTFSGNSLR